MSQTALLTPIFVLVLWTYAVFLVLAFGRIKYTENPQDAAYPKDLKGTMPNWVARAADKYTPLFEPPVAFYALTLCIAVINNFDSFMVQLAWAFVVLRIMHSLVQLTFNLVLLRFFIFVMGWLVLALMAYSQLFA